MVLRKACLALGAAIAAGAAHAQHEQHEMRMDAALGAYSMMREASGTSWQPDSSAHEGVMGLSGDWQWMAHGLVNAVHSHQGGPRGDDQSFSESMLMLMAQRPAAGGTFGVRAMFSLDPLMGKAGYPELFQTGETADGRTPLVDRQHPHNLFMELAATYSRPIAEGASAFVYVGLPGEPALGPPAFMHRFSASDNPEAPISHHWLDSTHITNGVVTAGLVRGDFKAEASAFRGREPDENRYRIEPGRLDSAAARLSWNPTPDWSLQVSHGLIKSPEALEPGVDVRRTTASASYNRRLPVGNWQATLAWGRNANRPGRTLDAFLVESAINLREVHTFLARLERVEKDELFADEDHRAGQAFTVNKASLGYVYDIPLGASVKLGIGAVASAFAVPEVLRQEYGERPRSYTVFVRLKLG